VRSASIGPPYGLSPPGNCFYRTLAAALVKATQTGACVDRAERTGLGGGIGVTLKPIDTLRHLGVRETRGRLEIRAQMRDSGWVAAGTVAAHRH
jgi:hypothetical protein